ncbi:WD repeat-containing protein on Y chromosome isoform X2 [Scyliorhinus canicula]|uniref:WD repeat-containing protein on Y chromosome isoform X2 n=1 Tax=Scyliorhinus canicula TaxID=7830 RepID=UPI0018F74D49|nr:WD repeat-containing protein on Y chromosome isoform X2 [Scyliorhinus canicula]
MPLGKKVRPSSAAGKLETYAISSIFHNIRPATVKSTTSRIRSSQPRAKTSIPAARSGTTAIEWFSRVDEKEQPEWLEWELLKQQNKRHSVGPAQNLAANENIHRFGDTLKSLRKGKIEQQVSLEHLKSIQTAFEDFENAGRKYLDVEAFKQIMRKCLGFHGVHDDQIGELFRKIDYSANDQIDWGEFCTYMQLKYKEVEESYTRSKRISFSLPATVRELTHAEQILRIYFTPDDTFIMMREDGNISFWSAELKLKRSRKLFVRPIGQKPKWITNFTIMSQYNKFILSTGDREIQIYELSTLEPYCQITGLESGPLQLDYCSTGEDDCMILYGDDQGCVNILLLKSVGETLRTWKKWPKVDNFPTISLENSILSPNVTCIRWKVHEDWITQMKYYDSIGAIISSSNHEASALVIGCTSGTTNLEKQMKEVKECWKEGKGIKCHGAPGVPQKRLECDQSVFRVHKGVKTFDFCKKNNLIVTGGMDRILRMWNPYVPGKPTALLRGHCAPIFFLCISPDDKLFSVSTDNTVKIWDIEDQCCLYTANSKVSRIKGDVSACHYVSGTKSLCIAADGIALLHLKIQPQLKPHHICSHTEPVLCCKYSDEFRQVITCSEGSVIKVWDLDTGNLTFEFSGAHDDSAICCMTFDDSGRRLITGGRDGCLKIWNPNNGHCLRILKKERCGEICDCIYVEMHKHKYVLAVGWDRRINIYCDSFSDHHHIQLPEPHWQDDLKRGHKDDILCIAQCPPTLLATSSYDGEIIVWNMISGHIYCRLRNPHIAVCTDREAVDKSVNKVVFLKTRVLKAELGASLVATGSQGSLAFWNLFHGGQLFGIFTASKVKSQLSSLAVSIDDSLLYAADSVGYIYVYGIKGFAVHGPEVHPPKIVNYWRAHVSGVTCMELIEEQKVIVTSSVEGTVRLWSVDGEFIGTFGQLQPWEIYAPASWQHPMVPYEILIDPLSMPIHPVLEGDTPVVQLINLEQSEENMENTESKDLHNSLKMTISDDDINEEIKKMTFQNNLGKRLRHERFQSLNKPLNHGGPVVYHTLKCFEISNSPITCEKPDLSAANTDPFLTICFKESKVEL